MPTALTVPAPFSVLDSIQVVQRKQCNYCRTKVPEDPRYKGCNACLEKRRVVKKKRRAKAKAQAEDYAKPTITELTEAKKRQRMKEILKMSRSRNLKAMSSNPPAELTCPSEDALYSSISAHVNSAQTFAVISDPTISHKERTYMVAKRLADDHNVGINCKENLYTASQQPQSYTRIYRCTCKDNVTPTPTPPPPPGLKRKMSDLTNWIKKPGKKGGETVKCTARVTITAEDDVSHAEKILGQRITVKVEVLP